VEFGPVGDGHNGFVASSLDTYRQMLVQFVQILDRTGGSSTFAGGTTDHGGASKLAERRLP
jgi:hypothetical protein